MRALPTRRCEIEPQLLPKLKTIYRRKSGTSITLQLVDSNRGVTAVDHRDSCFALPAVTCWQGA